MARAAQHLHPSAQSASLFVSPGSYSGYQKDPSQLPEDMVHTGRYSCFPNRLHTAVCGNNTQTVEAANSQQCAAAFLSSTVLTLDLHYLCFIIRDLCIAQTINGVLQPITTEDKAVL